MTATYLINRFPSTFLQGKSPNGVLFGSPPSYTNLKSFGCLCYASSLLIHRTNLDPKSVKCVFLRYPMGKKGYKLLALDTGKVFVSINVTLYEDTFPFSSRDNVHLFPLNSQMPITDLSSLTLLPNSIVQSPSGSQKGSFPCF